MFRFSISVSLVALTLCFVGCSGTEEANTNDAPAQTDDSQGSADTQSSQLSIQVLTALHKADQLDGTEDKVVERCYSCSLGMNGKEEFASKVGDYTVHFCKEVCKEDFDKDPELVVTSVEIPEAGELDADHDHAHFHPNEQSEDDDHGRSNDQDGDDH